MSEPHEIRGPYEAFVVATRRKDGKCPDLSKVLASKNGDCPIMMFDHVDEAKALATVENHVFKEKAAHHVDASLLANFKGPYGVYRVHVTFVEEAPDGR